MALSAHRKAELRKYLQIALTVLRSETFKSPNVTEDFYRSIQPNQSSVEAEPDVDESMGFLKKLILACARKYEIEMPRIKVKFSWLKEGEAAHVFMKDGVWYIEIDYWVYENFSRLTATIAHEMAHVVLGKCGKRLEPSLRNEELTDTVAILAGFGSIFFAVCSTEETIAGPDYEFVRHQTSGYLKRKDINYLLGLKENISADRTVTRWSPIKIGKSKNMFCYACGVEIRTPHRQGAFRIICPICTARQIVRLGSIYKGSSRLVQLAEAVILWPILQIGDRLRGFS